MPSNDEMLDRCVAICDKVVSELKALKNNAHRKPYDQQFARQIDYAVRSAHKIADRIAKLRDAPVDISSSQNGDRLNQLIALAKAMRPVVKNAPRSAWQQDILRQIDELTHG